MTQTFHFQRSTDYTSRTCQRVIWRNKNFQTVDRRGVVTNSVEWRKGVRGKWHRNSEDLGGRRRTEERSGMETTERKSEEGRVILEGGRWNLRIVSLVKSLGVWGWGCQLKSLTSLDHKSRWSPSFFYDSNNRVEDPSTKFIVTETPGINLRLSLTIFWFY